MLISFGTSCINRQRSTKRIHKKMTTAIDISRKNDGGVLKEIIKEGVGTDTPTPGSKVKVHYTGTLLNGIKFDSSKDRNSPFEFNLGQGSVIKAWDIGVATMKKEEVAMLICDAKYAYGKVGSPPKIPPNSTLKFEIEVLDWTGEDLSPDMDGSIERFQIVKGTEGGYPNERALVNIHLIGKFNDKIFEERDVQFNLGEGENEGIVEGIEYALLRFKANEKSRLKIKSKYAFKKIKKPEFGIPPNADVEYIVEMKNFSRAADTWAMEDNIKIEQAKLYKEKATNYFKANKTALAIKMGKKVISFLETGSFDDKIKLERDQLLLAGYLNIALFYLKFNEHFEAKNACSKALEIDSSNEKARFRRGQSLLALSLPEEAIKDFEKVIEIEPKNTAAAKQISICNSMILKNHEKDKKLYANMFEKMARVDKQREEERSRQQQQSDVMQGTLGEWGQEERPGGRDATAFEKENPNILMLNANGSGEFNNM